MREITIDIGPNGEVTIEGHGIDGPDCKALTKELEQALGQVEHVEKKPEYTRTRARARTTSR